MSRNLIFFNISITLILFPKSIEKYKRDLCTKINDQNFDDIDELEIIFKHSYGLRHE